MWREVEKEYMVNDMMIALIESAITTLLRTRHSVFGEFKRQSLAACKTVERFNKLTHPLLWAKGSPMKTEER